MAIIQQDDIWHDFFYTELTTGLRRGEICGLKWTDFDEIDGTLKVRRTIHQEKGGKLTAWDTKTAAGARTIILPPSTVELLRERQKSALTEWIFPDPLRPEQPTRPSAAYNRMKSLLKKADLPDLRFHDLRHTFATHALTSGVDVKTLSGILGHTKSAFTLDTYTHTTGDMQRRAAEIVEKFLTDIFGEELRPWGRKRKSGEGTVRLRKDGRWEGRVVIGYDEKGLPRTKNVLAKTKGECVEKLKTLKKSISPPTPSKVRADMPFGEWLDHWYETYSKPSIRPRTQRTYAGYIRLYIKPKLGGIPLNKLTTNDIQQFCAWMKSDDHMGKGRIADSQIRNCYSLCHRALEKARQSI